MLPDERAQSEIVGTVLLVGVVVVTVTTLGAGLLGSVTEADDPLGDVSGEVATDEIRLTHRGGESLAVAALEVVVRTDDGTTRIPFADGALAGSDPDRFDPGETWTRSASFAESEVVRVYLVHGSGSVLFEGRKVAAPTPTSTPGTTTTETTTETTTPANDPPTADATVSCDGLTCEFDASDSTDTDGSIESYEWEFGDGATATGPTASHTYGSGGTYTATLTVTDDDGDSDAETVEVAVAPLQPQLSAVSVTDRTRNDHADYRVAYDVTNRADFGNVTVEFENRQNGWSNATRRNGIARGFVEYQQSGVEGDTYDITVRVYNRSGAVTDVRALTDTADGSDADGGDSDLGDESSPKFAGTVVDDVSAYQADYEVSYNVTNRTNFSHVRVRVENLDSGGASATYTSAEPRTNVDDYAEADYGGTFGDSYRITMQVVDATGIVVDERVVTDAADGTDPEGNDDLGGPDSPELAGRWITDASDQTDGAVYSASYNVSNRTNFGRVEVMFRSLDDDSTTRTETLYRPRGRASYAPSYGNGQDYEIAFRVYDENGLKVDDVLVADPADGNEPGGNVLLPNSTNLNIVNVDVNDTSKPWTSEFTVNYTVSDPTETFGSVEVEYRNLDTGETVETDVATTPTGQVQLSESRWSGDPFEITVRVYDESGAIVDVRTITDASDGTDP